MSDLYSEFQRIGADIQSTLAKFAPVPSGAAPIAESIVPPDSVAAALVAVRSGYDPVTGQKSTIYLPDAEARWQKARKIADYAAIPTETLELAARLKDSKLGLSESPLLPFSYTGVLDGVDALTYLNLLRESARLNPLGDQGVK